MIKIISVEQTARFGGGTNSSSSEQAKHCSDTLDNNDAAANNSEGTKGSEMESSKGYFPLINYFS